MPAEEKQIKKIANIYKKEFKQATKNYHLINERNLNQAKKTRSEFLPTNLLKIQRESSDKTSLKRFLDNFANGIINSKSFSRESKFSNVPLFNRFQIRRKRSAQQDCNLNVMLNGSEFFYKIGVLLIKMTFSSTCRDNEYVKFFWINTFTPVTHFELDIADKKFVFLFGNVIQANSKYDRLVKYNSYKMLNLYRLKSTHSHQKASEERMLSEDTDWNKRRRIKPQKKNTHNRYFK